jgi:peptide/nickel transport system substrate-binding protein
MERGPGRWPFLLVLVAGVAGITAFWYAASGGELGDEPAFGGVYVEGVAGAPSRINPFYAPLNAVDQGLAALVFSGLTKLDAKGRPIPDLAESWEVSGNGRVYTFRLRPGVTWQDGAPFTANDVVFTYDLLRRPAARGPAALAALIQDMTVRRLDNLTVAFELPQAFGPLPSYLDLGILPSHLLGGTPAEALFDSPFNQSPVGTGPYVLEELSAERAVLSAYPGYHHGQPYISRFEMRFFRDDGALLSALRERRLDGALLGAGIGDREVADLESRAHLRVTRLSSEDVTLVYLNLRLPLFQDRKVRQALLYAIDRDAILESLPGQAARADSPLPPGTWAYQAAFERYRHDPALAGLLLDEAGWRRSATGVRIKDGRELAFTLATNSDPVRLAVATELARLWGEAGFKVTVEAGGVTALVRDLLEPRAFEAALFAYQLDSDPDPYPVWHSSQATSRGRNLATFQDEKADRLLEDARLTASISRRRDLYAEFQAYFAQEAPFIPLYSESPLYVQRASVRGVDVGFLDDAGSRFWQVQQWHVKTR